MSFTLPIGMIVASGRTTAPAGWLTCDGTTRTTSAYPALAAALGTAHNADYLARTGGAVPVGSFALPHLVDRHVIGASSTATVATVSNVNTHSHAFATSIAQGNNAVNRVTAGAHNHGYPVTNMNSAGSHDHGWGANAGNAFSWSTANGNINNARGSGTYPTSDASHVHNTNSNFSASDFGTNSSNHWHGYTAPYQNVNDGDHGHATVSVAQSNHNVTGAHTPSAHTVLYLIRAT